MENLKTISDLSSGFQGKVSNGIKFKQIKLKDVTKDGIINYDDLETFDSEKVNEKHLLKKGDIILKAKSGDNTAAIITNDIENVVATSHYIVIRVKKESGIDPEYLTMYLNSEYAQNYFKSCREGIAVPIIKIKDIENLKVIKVDDSEQKELAKIYRLLNEEKVIMQELIKARELQFKVHLRNTLENRGEKND